MLQHVTSDTHTTTKIHIHSNFYNIFYSIFQKKFSFCSTRIEPYIKAQLSTLFQHHVQNYNRRVENYLFARNVARLPDLY